MLLIQGLDQASADDDNGDADDERAPSQPAPLPPACSRSASCTGRPDVADLGFYDPVDAFWRRRVDFAVATHLSKSEQSLLAQLDVQPAAAADDDDDDDVGVQGLGSSDAVSYEDLMEFALDGPRHR